MPIDGGRRRALLNIHNAGAGRWFFSRRGIIFAPCLWNVGRVDFFRVNQFSVA